MTTYCNSIWYLVYETNPLEDDGREICCFRSKGTFKSIFLQGIDCEDLYQVSHFHLPSDINYYCQDKGRVGRAGTQSEACSVVPRSSLARVIISPFMKLYVKNVDTCRKSVIIKCFGLNKQTSDRIHNTCCDLCSALCKCESCQQIPFASELEMNSRDSSVKLKAKLVPFIGEDGISVFKTNALIFAQKSGKQ